MPRNSTDPFRDDTEMACSIPPDASRSFGCYCQTDGFDCDQGRKCPVRTARHDDEISDRRYLAKYALCVAGGALSLWVLLFPLGVLALIKEALK